MHNLQILKKKKKIKKKMSTITIVGTKIKDLEKKKLSRDEQSETSIYLLAGIVIIALGTGHSPGYHIPSH